MEHVRSPSSRFIALRRYKDEWSFVVSPWIVRRPGEEAWIRAMLRLATMLKGAHLLPLVAHAFLDPSGLLDQARSGGRHVLSGTDLQFSIVETSKAQSAAAFAEHVFNLPSHHLS
ncbi:hypothetical protein, partial [Enterobacter cloacae]|uniref:hypothetical protein n=1 Tax=Enterobacter cloacae TaxID=550 RepID=UPI00197A71D2